MGQRLTILSILTLVLGALAVLGSATPAQAAQAPGHDVPIYANGWSWTYQTTFTYDDGASTDATINENVTYTNAGPVTFMGQDAYKLDITGTITGGSGGTDVDSIGHVDLSNFSGTVVGTRYVRRSDLALLQESQQQHLNGDAEYSIFTIDVTADIDLTLTPSPAWRAHDFPLNGGDSYQEDTDVSYSGGFDYDSSVASGSGPFEGTLDFDAPATVATGSVSVPIGTPSTDNISATSSDGTVDNHWWSPTHKADARHYMRIPMDDGAVATIDRRLSAASTPTPGTTMTETITPSLTCAGAPVTVAGKVGTTAGVPVTIAIDKSPVNPGQQVTTTTTTTANGNYSATITAPNENDGMSKNGSRANWGVLVSGGGATNVATLVVTPQNCTTLAYTGVTSAPQGTDAAVAAQITDLSGASVAGRTISFALGGGASVTAVTNAAGVAAVNLPVNSPPRTTTITATYEATTTTEGATASAPFTVGKISTTTSVVANPPIVTLGDPVTFTATVAPSHGGDPGGSVQFNVDGNDFGAAVPLSGGTATSPGLSTLPLGYHDVVAVYLGTADHAGSESAPYTFRVRNPLLSTTTTSSVSPGSAVFGQPVTLSADVTSSGNDATGSVTFTSGSTTLATTGVNGAGHAEVVVSDIPVGSYQVVATYSGDDVYAGSAASQKNLTVAKAGVDVELSSSDTSTVTGEAVNFTATVGAQPPGGGSPDGTVQLRIDGVDVGAPVALVGGTATFPAVTSMGAGTHAVAAVYSGSADYAGGQDSLQQDVSKADTSALVLASPSPAVEDQAATLTARIGAVAPGSGAPTGTVSFTANGDALGAAPLQAVSGGAEAAIDISDLAAGSYTIVATYAGDGDYNGSESQSITHVVIAATAVVETTTVVSSSENPSTYGELVTFTANVTAADSTTPVGTVQFSMDGTNFGDPVPVGSDGVAESVTLASPDPGDHTVIAAFTGATGYSGSGDIITQTVDAAGVDVGLTSSDASSDYGQGVTFTAAITSQQVGTGSPTGYAQFLVDGQPLGNAVELDGDGEATSQSVSNLLPGDHEVRVLYSGDAYFVSGANSITQGVAKVVTTTVLTATPTSTTYGQTVALSAKVTPAVGTAGTPGGTVVFKRGTTTIATVPVAAGSGSSAVATTSVSDLGAGSHAIRAEYSGTAVFAASTSAPVTVTVGQLATSLKTEPALVKVIPLGLPLGLLQVTLTGGGQPVVGAPIEFRIGTKLVCTSTTDAQGVATCDAASQILLLTLNLGYKASYAGDANHLPTQGTGSIIK